MQNIMGHKEGVAGVTKEGFHGGGDTCAES